MSVLYVFTSVYKYELKMYVAMNPSLHTPVGGFMDGVCMHVQIYVCI